MSGPFGASQWMYSTGGEEVAGNSLRFNDDSSQYLNRTPASAGNSKIWTLSMWVKRGNTIPTGMVFSAGTSNTELFYMQLLNNINSNKLRFFWRDGNTTNRNLWTDAQLRDVSAWYHIVVSVDTAQTNVEDRMRIFINGDLNTSFTLDDRSTLSSSSSLVVNSTAIHTIGRYSASSSNFFDGYLSNVYLIDGTALEPTSFGEFKNGYWKIKDYSGSYGTNGFYLELDGAVTDSSDNGNDWTANNISAHDYVPDNPTNNFATLNSTSYGKNGAGNAPIFFEGNLRIYEGGSSWSSSLSTITVSSGKWYAESVIVTGTNSLVGVIEVDEPSLFYSTNSMYMGSLANSYGYLHNGTVYNNNIASSYGATYTTGDVIGIALDMDAGTLTFYKNGVSQGTAATGLAGRVAFGFSSNISNIGVNFGQDSTFAGATTTGGNTDAKGIGDFKYAPPAGYLALCTSNLPTPTIVDGSEHFNTVLYTGNGSTNAVIGVGFDLSSDGGLVWIKNRTSSYSHGLYDTVRGTGTTKSLSSNVTGQEGFYSSYHNLVSFDSDGFTLGSTSLTNGLNASGNSHVAWNWKAGGTAVLNEDGTIDSQVSANVDAGFSIVSWSGNATTGATAGHGLSTAPSIVITKARTYANLWQVNLSSNVTSTEGYLKLNSTDAVTTIYPNYYTSMDSSVLTFNGTTFDERLYNNRSGEDYIAYCFHNSDVCKVGSYTGNGSSNGPMVYTGMAVSWVMVKRTDGTGWWGISDSARSPFNEVANTLAADFEYSESYLTSDLNIDFLSNGFKIRDTDAYYNADSGIYMYLAFAENPFKYSNAR